MLLRAQPVMHTALGTDELCCVLQFRSLSTLDAPEGRCDRLEGDLSSAGRCQCAGMCVGLTIAGGAVKQDCLQLLRGAGSRGVAKAAGAHILPRLVLLQSNMLQSCRFSCFVLCA